MNAANICSLALALWAQGDEGGYDKRLSEMAIVCEHVVEKAESLDMDPYIAAAIAWEESRFNAEAVSPEGAIGPMQVIPRWACPNRTRVGCDLVDAGVNAYLSWLKKYEKPREALCHYNSGNRCNDRSRGYARRVTKRAAQLRQVVEVCQYSCGC